MKYDMWGLAAFCAALCVLLFSPGTEVEREAMRTVVAGLMPD